MSCFDNCCGDWAPPPSPTRWQRFKKFIGRVLHPIRTYREWRWGKFFRLTMPAVRAVYPMLIAKDIVEVQPMTMPDTSIFDVDYRYSAVQPVRYSDVKPNDTFFVWAPAVPTLEGEELRSRLPDIIVQSNGVDIAELVKEIELTTFLPKPVSAKDHPRPKELKCIYGECGGVAVQVDGPQYHCIRCERSMTVWTGFDDPAWF